MFAGNGVSELIDCRYAHCSIRRRSADPSPDYTLWSAATILNDGRPVYYRCDAQKRLSAGTRGDRSAGVLAYPRHRAYHPNNPSGASYPRELLERIVAIAAKHKLLLMVDEIYDQVLYDGAEFVPVAPLAGDQPA